MINANFSAWSIRQPIPAMVLFAVLMALGAVTFSGMSVTKFPNIDVPVIAATITQSGAAPAELRQQVTKRVEDAVASLAGVKHVQSTITDGASTTAIEFRLETDTDRALNDVKDAIAKVRADLPRSIDEPIISRVDVEGSAIIIYTLQAPNMTLEELSWFADDTVKRQLQSLKGVGRVERYGGVDREIQIKLDPDRLMALGITAGDVNQQIRATNADLAGGRGDIGGQEQSIRTLASARSLPELANTKISIPGGREVRLSELGQVIDGAEEERFFARRDGEPAVALAVFRAKGASEVDVARVVEKKVDELTKAYPDVKLSITDDQVSYTFGNYEAAMGTLLEGALLAVVIVLVFLRDWRATLITAVALPLSIIPTYWIMELMGFSLNLVSLLALTLATGILIDDAIVEIENIVRHMRMGKSAYRAAIEGADEIGLAVIAISLTIVAVFAPVSFMGGIAGQYFKQFGLTVAAAVLVSLLVARLITPVLAAYFLSSGSAKIDHEKEGWVTRAYASFLRFTLRHKILSVLTGIGLFYGSLQLLPMLPTGFIPEEDSGRLQLTVELPPGSRLADTRAVTDDMAGRIRRIPEVISVFVLGGAGAQGAGEVRQALMIVRLTNKATREIKQKQIASIINGLVSGVPDVRVFTSNERGERELTITVTGPDPEKLRDGVVLLEGAMRQVPEFINVSASSGLDRPEIRVKPRLEEAAKLGIAPENIAEMVRVATIGDSGPNLAKFNAGDRQIPIRVQLDTGARADLASIKAMRVRTGSGGSVPLSEVADISFGSGPSSIERYDRVDRIVIGADLATGVQLGQATDLVDALPAVKQMPAGVAILKTGDAEVMAEVFSGFAQAMGLGLLIVFGLLVLLFGNLFHPITILLSLPLALGGVFGALLLTGNAISMPVVIGILMLIGIVTKNAILLVDFAVERVKHGMSRFDAIVDAGRKRARPIIKTTVAMVCGMVPTALGHGDGGEFRAPMAIAVIGGLIVSTLLSLIFVPSLYLVMEAISSFFAWMLRGLINKVDEPPEFAGVPVAAAAPTVATPDVMASDNLAQLPLPLPMPAEKAAA